MVLHAFLCLYAKDSLFAVSLTLSSYTRKKKPVGNIEVDWEILVIFKYLLTALKNVFGTSLTDEKSINSYFSMS